jgi:hypothetical protein
VVHLSLIHLTLADAFGSHVDPNKSRNSEMRDFICRCRKVIEKVNKIKTLKVTLEKKLPTDFGYNMKLRNSPNHLLKCWGQICNALIEEGVHFPIATDCTLLMELRSIIHPIRFIQTIAQKPNELAVFQVYILLMEAFFGVLHEKHPRPSYDPTATSTLGQPSDEPDTSNPLDNLKPTYIKNASELDPRTTSVRKILQKAMMQCFYNRYHPKAAYKQKVTCGGQKKDFIFSYLIDLQALFHPALSNGRLLYQIIFSFNDATREDKERHYSTLKG